MDGMNFNKDIDMDFNLLSETIARLKTDNERISEIINKIYDNMNTLNDEEIWKSPEKEQMMNELMPYLNDTKTSLYNDLSNCLEVLKMALNNYTEDDALLSIGAKEITEIVEE